MCRVMATKIPALLKIVKDKKRGVELATACNTTTGYLKLIALGHQQPGAKLAVAIAQHTSIPRAVLRPDIFGRAA